MLSEVPTSLQSVLSGSQKTPPALDRVPYQLIRLSERRTLLSLQRVPSCFQKFSSLIKLSEDPTIPLEDQPSRGPNDAFRGPYQPCRGPYDAFRGPYHPSRGPYQALRGPYQPSRWSYHAIRVPYQPSRGPYNAFRVLENPTRPPERPIRLS